jgi:flagellar assembly protein FliH
MSFRARRLVEPSVEPFPWETMAARPAPTAMAVGGGADGPDEQARLAALERDAFAKGYAQGEHAGAESASARANDMLCRLGQTVEELAALRTEIIRRTERQTVQLVVAIAERVVQREVTLDRGLLVGMARAALDRLGEYGSATIRLNPEDYSAISAPPSAEGAPLRVLADPSVSRGGCLVQSDFGFMDVSPESQFRELARALLADAATPPQDADASHGIVLK